MSARQFVAPVYLALCLLFGGATQGGFLANMVLQLMAIPIIVWSLLVRRHTPMNRHGRVLILFLLMMLALILIQLVPMPPDLWQALPGRDRIADGYQALNVPLPWLPISLQPTTTLADLLWLLPPIAVLLSILRLGAFRVSWLLWTIIGFTAVSIFIGAAQVASGNESPLYFYSITNWGAAVGFFANANHLSTLMLMTMPLLAAIQAGETRERKRRDARRRSGLLVITIGMYAVIGVGFVISGSLAGMGLGIPVAAASFLLMRHRDGPLPWWPLPGLALLTLASVALVFADPFGAFFTSAGLRGSETTREESFSTTIVAARDFVPVGSGIGTFVPVYRTKEEPAGVDNIFWNHAHNDYLEVWLETGIAGVVMVLLFLAWWSRLSYHLWRSDKGGIFARAAVIASAAALAHSLVDYPLRTAAVASLFAAMVALMTEPRAKGSPPVHDVGAARHLSSD